MQAHGRSGDPPDALLGTLSATVPATLALVLLALVAAGSTTGAISAYFLALVLLAGSVAVSAGSIAFRLTAASTSARAVRLGPIAQAVVTVVSALVAAAAFLFLQWAVDSRADAAAFLALVLPPVGLIVLNGVSSGLHRSLVGLVVLGAAPAAAAAFLWVVVTVIRVSLVAPIALAAGQSEARLGFSASAGVGYDVRVGGSGCGDGVVVAAGSFGPAAGVPGQSPDRDRIVVEIPRWSLPAPRNIIRVCVRDGVRLGSATVSLEVDDVAPVPPTITAEPATDAGDAVEATSRRVRLSGTAEPGTMLEIRLDDAEFAHPRIAGGRWEADWWVASSRLEATVQAISRDRAGNESRSPTLLIRFVGSDPPGVPALGHPAVLIECRAALTTLSPATCAELGGRAIGRALQLERSTHRIVLARDDEGCAAVFLDRSDRLVTFNRFDCPDGT